MGNKWGLLYFLHKQGFVAEDFEDADTAARGDGGTVGQGREFVDAAAKADLDLSVASARLGDAKIDFCLLAQGIVDVVCSVGFQAHEFFAHDEEEGGEDAAYGYGESVELPLCGQGVVEADACPAEADEEVDE